MWLAQLYRRFRHLIHEVGKFGIVGAVAYGADTAIYVLARIYVEPLTAKTIATVIAATLAFVGNRFWTWRHRERSGLAREYTLYFCLNGVALGIALGIVAINYYGLGALWPGIFRTAVADLIAAQIIGVAVGSAFRFWSYRRFVFRHPSSQYAAGELAPAVPDSHGA